MRQLESELEQARQRFASLVEYLPYAYFTADLDGTLDSANHAAEELTGYSPGDRPNFQDVIVPEDLPRAIADLALVATEPNAGAREYRFRRANGEIRNVEINTVSLQRDGELIGFQGTARDLTEQKRAEKALQESEARFRQLAELLPGIIYEYDLSGRVTYTNMHAKEVTGYTREDVKKGVSILSLLAPEEYERAFEVQQRLLAGEGPFTRQYDFVMKDGQRIPVEATSVPILQDGEVVGVRGLAHDLTAIRQAEAEKRELTVRMQRAQKLESLGVLAGGVAHDFNNLLQVILGNVSLALSQLEEENPTRERLEAARVAARHARDLSGQMLAYSGSTPVLVGPNDLNDALGEMLDLVTAAVPKQVTLVVDTAPEPLWIEADRTQIQQVFLNLVTNAAEALGPEPGRVTISTRSRLADGADLASTLIDDELPEGTYVVLEVTDTGSGMDEETLHRIFDPFFTTKPAGRGLGLAAAFGIVRSHRGAIQASSEPSEGTRFRVLLPQIDPPEVAATPEVCGASNAEPGGMILLVDDELEVRESTGMILESAGYDVLHAADGLHAVATFEKRHREVRAVVLDLSMPGLDGLGTFHELRKVEPEVPVVLCSGYSRQDVASRFRGLSVTAFLKKPYEMADLISTIHQALRTRPPKVPGTEC